MRLALICLMGLAFVHLSIREGTFEFDDSLNMQTSVSLAKDFIYKNSYSPSEIHGFSVTTNGPIQYVMAAGIAIFGIDIARVAVMDLIFAAFLCSIYFYLPFSAAVFSILLLIWPIYLNSATCFLGEIAAIAFCVLGLTCFERFIARPKTRAPFLAGILFGLAIATKFIVAFLVPFLLLAAIFGKAASPKSQRIRYVLQCYVLALCIFIGMYYFAVAHSLLAIYFFPLQKPFQAIQWRGFLDFLVSHFNAERAAPATPKTPLLFIYNSPWLIAFFLSCGLISIYKNKYVIFLWVACISLMEFANLNERRLLPYLFFLIFFGCEAFFNLVKKPLETNLRTLEKCLIAIFIVGFLFSFWQSRKLAINRVRTVWALKNHTDARSLALNKYGRFPEFIKYAEYPIVTSGWWQVPELSLETGVSFFDRLRPENQELSKYFERIYLLARERDQAYWPYTSKKLCGRIILEENGYLFCEFKKGLRLDTL